jgi:hypothetical protein
MEFNSEATAMPRRFRSSLYLCAALAAAVSHDPAIGSPVRRPLTVKVIVDPRIICYPLALPFCDDAHRPPAIYNTPCGVWWPNW